MKKILTLTLVIATLSTTGCNKLANDFKHIKSAYIGLNRTITLYDGNSTNVLGRWKITSQVEHNGGEITFIDANGKSVSINGTYIVQEN